MIGSKYFGDESRKEGFFREGAIVAVDLGQFGLKRILMINELV